METKTIKVLLIEDNPGDARLMQEALSEVSAIRFSLEHVDRLSTGLEYISGKSYDVVLLDLGLPDSAGLDTLARLYCQVPEVPIVVLTGLNDEVLGAKAISEGAQDYLVKGQITGDLVIRSIRHSIERHQAMSDALAYARELETIRGNIKNIIEASVDGSLVVNKEGVVLFANPAAESLFECRAEELKGQCFSYPIVLGKTVEIDIPTKDGQTAVAEMCVVETEWDGEPVYLASLRDITERKRMLAELEQTRQEQSGMKDQFLSRVSHELRSPLATVHQFVTILLDGLAGGINPEQREYLDIALRNVNQLRTMVGDLLEVTRAQTGRLAVEPRRVSLAELIYEAIDNLQAANNRNISISAEVSPNLPYAYADPERVQQILSNLLNNAMRFTPEDGRITVRASISNEAPESVCVQVADTGNGIRPEDKERIFEYLYQAENGSGGSRRGLGLGLYICKELVSRHGGRIWVESQPGHGSTFFFNLPIFSLAKHLTPLLTSPNLAMESIALVTVELFPMENRLLTKSDDEAMGETWRVLQTLTGPNLDVLLPRMASTQFGETMFIVAHGNREKLGSLARKLRKQLAQCESLQDADLKAAISSTILDVPSGKDRKLSGEIVNTIGTTIDRRADAAFRKRKIAYERAESASGR